MAEPEAEDLVEVSRMSSDAPVTCGDIRAALNAVLGSQPSPKDQCPIVGCSIKWRPGTSRRTAERPIVGSDMAWR
jgi:hypothetical protein